MRHFTYANVMATAAVFIALGGTSYAAIKVTGKNITDGTVTGRDLKDKSVGTKDLAVSARGLRGSGGPQGATGPQGPKGDAGTNGAKGDKGDPASPAQVLTGNGEVSSADIADDSLTASDLAGGQSTGSLSLSAGYVADGRCRDASIGVGGAHAGDVALFSVIGAVPQGIVMSAVRVPSDGLMTLKVCNFTGTTMTAITDLPVVAVSITP
jgi:hypothetical protein